MRITRVEYYLKDLHEEGLNGFALVNHSLTAYFQPTNLFCINSILFKKGSNCRQTESPKRKQNPKMSIEAYTRRHWEIKRRAIS